MDLWGKLIEAEANVVNGEDFHEGRSQRSHYDCYLEAERRLETMPRERFVNLLGEVLEEHFVPKCS